MSQVAIAWTLARDSKVVPLVEGRYGSRLTDVLAAARLRMSADDLARIDAALGKDADIAPPRPKQAPERSHGRNAERDALVAAPRLFQDRLVGARGGNVGLHEDGTCLYQAGTWLRMAGTRPASRQRSGIV